MPGNHGYKNAYTAKVDAWVANHAPKPAAALLKRAAEAIGRILGEDSELRQLWEETGETEWPASVEDLRRRLQAR